MSAAIWRFLKSEAVFGFEKLSQARQDWSPPAAELARRECRSARLAGSRERPV
ncbi:MAG: hypothetical protein AAB474_02595 [Patescibacteria group bacterium]